MIKKKKLNKIFSKKSNQLFSNENLSFVNLVSIKSKLFPIKIAGNKPKKFENNIDTNPNNKETLYLNKYLLRCPKAFMKY